MKKILSLLMILVVLVSGSVILTSAMYAPNHVYGDVNCDRDIDVTDATQIQMCLAGVKDFSKLSYELADFDGDGKVNVTDATQIQMYEAKIIKYIMRYPYAIYTLVEIENVSCDFESGKAIAGVPVTFSARASVPYGEDMVYPITYEYIIKDGEQVIAMSEKSTDADFSYTFEKGGIYTVQLLAYNSFGEYSSYELEYIVLDEYSGELMVSAVYPSKFGFDEEYDERVFTAHAYGGEAPYEYRFIADGTNVVQDFSESNSVSLKPVPDITRHMELSMTVEVRDANGNVASDSCIYMVFANLPK